MSMYIRHERAYDSLVLSSLPPAAVTVPSIQPNRVVFFVLLYRGLSGQIDLISAHRSAFTE